MDDLQAAIIILPYRQAFQIIVLQTFITIFSYPADAFFSTFWLLPCLYRPAQFIVGLLLRGAPTISEPHQTSRGIKKRDHPSAVSALPFDYLSGKR